jgi:glycosyltransferase involved in cell wall biosynthesis
VTHLLIISHDVVGRTMAGTGIRYWEMAHVLAAQQPTVLLAPQPIDLEPRTPALTCGSVAPGDTASMAPWLAQARVIVTNGFVLKLHPELVAHPAPLVVDLYNPVLLENLERFREAPLERQAEQYAYDHAMLAEQLAAGDFFLCATERQRDLYMGALAAAGRLTPEQVRRDATLRSLIDVAGFGLPAAPPPAHQPALRGVVPGIAPDSVVLLWTGGLWDWLDPLTLIRVLPQVVARVPQVRLVFLAGQHPGAVHGMQMPQRAYTLAAELGLLDRFVFFHTEWVPYEQRAHFLRDADIAISLHRRHLETDYAAVRSRFLDHLWIGLPSIVSAGDAAAELVRRYNLGYTVEPEDGTALEEAICRLASDAPQRQRLAAHAREIAADFTWKRTLAPLVQFCAAPVRQRALTPTPTAAAEPQAPGETAVMQQEQQSRIQQIEQVWHLDNIPPQGNILSRLARRVLLRLLAPVFAQQRDFNGGTVRLFYDLLSRQEANHAEVLDQLRAVMAQVVALQQGLHGRLDVVVEHADAVQRDLHARIDTLAEFTGKVSERIDTLEGDMNGRLDTMADYHRELNDHIARLTYTVQLLDDAVAAADEASAGLAGHLALLQTGADAAPPDAQAGAADSGTQAGVAPRSKRS